MIVDVSISIFTSTGFCFTHLFLIFEKLVNFLKLKFYFVYLFIYWFIFGCAGPSLLPPGFL